MFQGFTQREQRKKENNENKYFFTFQKTVPFLKTFSSYNNPLVSVVFVAVVA